MADPSISGDRWISAAIHRRCFKRALELLVKTHGQQLGRLTYALVGNQAEAEELAQEVLIAAYRAMPRFRGEAQVKTWLFSIARKVCWRAVQQRQRRIRLTAEAPLEPGVGADLRDPHLELERRQQARILRRALMQLTEARREVLLLRYAGGLTYREVSAACGVKEEAARQRAAAGLRQLRRILRTTNQSTRPAGDAPDDSVAACQELSIP